MPPFKDSWGHERGQGNAIQKFTKFLLQRKLNSPLFHRSRKDNQCFGSVESLQHSNIRGLFKGGIRFHQDCNLNEVKALVSWMALKYAEEIKGIFP